VSLSALLVKVILKELYWSLPDVFHLVSIVYMVNPGWNGLGFLKEMCFCGAFMEFLWYRNYFRHYCFVVQSFTMLFVLIVFSEKHADYAFHFVNGHRLIDQKKGHYKMKRTCWSVMVNVDAIMLLSWPFDLVSHEET